MCKLVLPALAGAVAAALLAPSMAAAAPTWNCSASALDAALLGQPAVSPVTANDGAPACKATSAGGALPALPPPLTADVVSARTALDGPAGAPSQQAATATGAVASLTIGPLPSLPGVPLPPVPITTVPDPTDPGGPPIDITRALQALAAPSAALLSVRAASATAAGRCLDGRPQLTGSAHVGSLAVLGQELPTDQALDRTLSIGGATIDPSQLTPASLPAPLDRLPVGIVAPLLDALPDIPVPASPVQVHVTPAAQTTVAGRLTQTGPRVLVAVAGQPVADLTLGRASVTQADACGQAVSEAQLQCTTRKLTLIDVLQRGGHVRLYGAADRRYVGRRVRIVSSWNGRTVATPKVARDGTFRAQGMLPPATMRHTNRARYQARIGRERSLRLKLFRRMLVTRMSSAKGRVTIAGRVVRPLGQPVQRITIKRRISCTKDVVVKSLKPDSRGRFSVTIAGPPHARAAVYRLATKVRKNTHNRKLFPTFTLPRAVELRT